LQIALSLSTVDVSAQIEVDAADMSATQRKVIHQILWSQTTQRSKGQYCHVA